MQLTTSIQVAGVSHVLGSVQRVSHKFKICVSRERRLLQDQVQGYWSEGSTVGWYFGIGQGSGKILYTCNHLIVDQWILGSGDLKITQ